jgi:formate dehydrogenase major subunit
MKKGISRRDFLKSLGIGTAGVALFEGASAAPALAKENLPDFKLGPFKLKRTKETASVCAYCGCGCGIIVYSENNKVVFIEGDPDNPINEGALCPKGTTISDVSSFVDKKSHQRVPNKQRVTEVLYRAPGGSNWEVKDWNWALSEIAKRVKKTRDEAFEEKDDKGVTVNRTQAIAHLGSATIDNEENYLMYKLMRSLGVINLDHCARL